MNSCCQILSLYLIYILIINNPHNVNELSRCHNLYSFKGARIIIILDVDCRHVRLFDAHVVHMSQDPDLNFGRWNIAQVMIYLLVNLQASLIFIIMWNNKHKILVKTCNCKSTISCSYDNNSMSSKKHIKPLSNTHIM